VFLTSNLRGVVFTYLQLCENLHRHVCGLWTDNMFLPVTWGYYCIVVCLNIPSKKPVISLLVVAKLRFVLGGMLNK